MDLVILKPMDQDAVLAYARGRAELSESDPMERELASWQARWRPEQLNHYLQLGWCFGAKQMESSSVFLLAQPLLFFRGLTQTLWVETIETDNADIGAEL